MVLTDKKRHEMPITKTSRANSDKSVWQGLSFVLMLLCCLSTAFADEIPKTAKLLPGETIVLLDISDFQQVKSQFEKTCLYRLYKDPAMAAFVGNSRAKFLEKIQKLDDNDVFKTLFNAEVQPQERVSFALVLNEQSRDFNDLQIAIVTQWGQGIDKIKESIEGMLQKNIEYGGHQKSSEDYRGVSIQITIDEASSVMNHCFIDDYFIATTDLDLLKFIIAHIKGASSSTLSDDTDYSTAMKAVGPYHDIDFYINLKQIIKTTIVKDSTGQTAVFMANIGVDNVSALGISIALAREPGISGSGKAFLKINGAKKGICKILEVDSAVIKAPRFITSPAYSATFFNLDVKKAYDELYSILYTFNPQYTGMMNLLDLPDSPTGEPGIKLKDDIIDNLGSQIIVSESANKPFSNTSAPTESLVALAVSNRDALEKSLSLLHSKRLAPGDPDARRELLGRTIYLLRPSALPFLTRRGTAPEASVTKLAFTITDTHLIFGTEPVIERVIRTLTGADAVSIDDTKWFPAAKSVVPSAVGIATFQDNAASSELFWWTVKEGSTAQPATDIGPMKFDELVDYSLLPEFDSVRKHFGTSAFYGISKPDGFLFELKYLNPSSAD